MSAFIDMISAFIALLMSAAFLHFGAVDGTVLRDTPDAPPAVMQSHSESSVSHQPATTESPDSPAQPQAASLQRTAWK